MYYVYLTKAIARLTQIGINPAQDRVNQKLEPFSIWNQTSLSEHKKNVTKSCKRYSVFRILRARMRIYVSHCIMLTEGFVCDSDIWRDFASNGK